MNFFIDFEAAQLQMKLSLLDVLMKMEIHSIL